MSNVYDTAHVKDILMRLTMDDEKVVVLTVDDITNANLSIDRGDIYVDNFTTEGCLEWVGNSRLIVEESPSWRNPRNWYYIDNTSSDNSELDNTELDNTELDNFLDGFNIKEVL